MPTVDHRSKEGGVTTEIGSERDYLETGLLEIVSRYGGEQIVAGPQMEALIRDIADFVESKKWIVGSA